jgi:hypothetical protein
MHSDKKVKGKRKSILIENDFSTFVGGLEQAVGAHIDSVPVYTMHKRGGQIFRSNTEVWGGVWRDWVIVDWGLDGKLPCKLWGFVDLRELPLNTGISYGGLEAIDPGRYAIVESTTINADDAGQFFRRIHTDVGGMNGNRVRNLRFYLADVEAFEDGAVVVPDIDGEANSYLWVAPPSQWASMFEDWLDQPLQEDDYITTDEEDSGNEEGSTESDAVSTDEGSSESSDDDEIDGSGSSDEGEN